MKTLIQIIFIALCIALALLQGGCAIKDNIDPPANTKEVEAYHLRILQPGEHCTIAKDILGLDDYIDNDKAKGLKHSLNVVVDSMKYTDTEYDNKGNPNQYFVAVTTSDGWYYRYPDVSLLDCH